MPVSHNDKQILSQDPTFQNRVKMSLVTACINLKTEDPKTIPFHREREAFAVAVMNAPDTFKANAATAVSTDTNVINDATVSGTVALTSGNVAAQAINVADAHIDTAISGQFNTFFRTPAN
jgi:hypothetical protein